MKATKNQIETMDKIMGAVTQSDAWLDIQSSDPDIQLAEKKYNQVMGNVSACISSDLKEELNEAVFGCINALERPAILYGIFLVDTVRAVASNPTALSKFMMKRTGRDAE